MANKWIEFVRMYAKKNNMKYNEAMKDPQCKASYKKGGGIIDDTKEYIKNEGRKYIKEKARNLVDQGSDLIKDRLIGKGLFSNIMKPISNFVIDNAPLPNVVKDVGKIGTNYLIDKSGMGMKRKYKKNGSGALYLA